jgi:hypothetical protein
LAHTGGTVEIGSDLGLTMLAKWSGFHASGLFHDGDTTWDVDGHAQRYERWGEQKGVAPLVQTAMREIVTTGGRAFLHIDPLASNSVDWAPATPEARRSQAPFPNSTNEAARTYLILPGQEAVAMLSAVGAADLAGQSFQQRSINILREVVDLARSVHHQ